MLMIRNWSLVNIENPQRRTARVLLVGEGTSTTGNTPYRTLIVDADAVCCSVKDALCYILLENGTLCEFAAGYINQDYRKAVTMSLGGEPVDTGLPGNVLLANLLRAVGAQGHV